MTPVSPPRTKSSVHIGRVTVLLRYSFGWSPTAQTTAGDLAHTRKSLSLPAFHPLIPDEPALRRKLSRRRSQDISFPWHPLRWKLQWLSVLSHCVTAIHVPEEISATYISPTVPFVGIQPTPLRKILRAQSTSSKAIDSNFPPNYLASVERRVSWQSSTAKGSLVRSGICAAIAHNGQLKATSRQNNCLLIRRFVMNVRLSAKSVSANLRSIPHTAARL
jgi:hypothetical protein